MQEINNYTTYASNSGYLDVSKEKKYPSSKYTMV